MKNILFVVLDAGYAGHTRTALCIARALKKRGYRISFLVDAENLDNPIEPFELFKIKRKKHTGYLFGLYTFLKNNHYDIIHIFEKTGSAELSIISSLLHLPTVSTICGPVVKMQFIPHTWNIFLSSDFYENIGKLQFLIKHRFSIIPNRIEIKNYNIKEKQLNYLMKKKKEGYKIILRIAQIHEGKRLSILLPLESLKVKEGKYIYLFTGLAVDKDLEDKVRIEFENSLDSYYLKEFSRNPEALLSVADIVIGSGRSCLEAMAANKPCIIVGKKSVVGLLNESNKRDLIATNFSGRSEERVFAYKDKINIFNKCLEVCNDSNKLKYLIEMQNRLINDYYSSDTGALKYENIYKTIKLKGLRICSPILWYSLINYIIRVIIRLLINDRRKEVIVNKMARKIK